MAEPIDAYRQHSTVCNTVTFSPWVQEKVQPLCPGRTSDTPRRRPKRFKPKLYEYDAEPGTEKVAYSALTNKLRNTMARPRDYPLTTKATTLRTEEPSQRTPALPDPNAPEEEMIRIAQSSLDSLFSDMVVAESKVAAAGAEEPGGGVVSWLPAILGGAGGLGAYALARHPFKGQKGSALAKIREMAGGRMVRGDVPELVSGSSFLEKLKHYFRYGPTVDPEDAGQVAKFLKSQKKGKGSIWLGDELAPRKAFNPALGPNVTRKGERAVSNIIEDLEDKLTESRLLEKFAPRTSAKTLDIGDVLQKYSLKLRKGKNLPEDLAKLQKALKTEFGSAGHMIKTRASGGAADLGVASSGVFPTEATDMAAAYAKWKEMKPEFKRLARESSTINRVIEKFRGRPGYEGRVVDEMLRGNAIVQEKLLLEKFGPRVAKYMKSKGYGPTRESRVHVVGGQVIPSLAMPRYPTPGALLDYARARKAARWVQENVVKKLPVARQGVSMGVDVAPLRGGGYKIIELNVGGQSGLLDNPVGSHLLHKAVTGRYAKPVAGVLAGAGAAGGVGAGYGTEGLLAGPKKEV